MYAPWEALYLSFFSKELYKQVARSWKGVAFLYLLAVVLISVTLTSLQFYMVVDNLIKGPVAEIISKLPDISIKDGTMSINKKSPYEVTFTVNRASGSASKLMAVFDVNREQPKENDETPFWFCKHSWYMYSSRGNFQQYEWAMFEGKELNKASYQQVADQVRVWVPSVYFALGIPFWFLFYAFESLIFAAIGMAIAGIANIKLTFGELVRLAVVASTPGLIFEPILKFAFPGLIFGVGFLMTIGYSIFALLSNKEAAPASTTVVN